MTAYVDASALLKRYIDEPNSDEAERLLMADSARVTARHTVVEVRRNLARLLDGRALAEARAAFAADLAAFAIIELDAATIEQAAIVAEQTGARTLEALHLGAAQRLGGQTITFVTFDARQAAAARVLGMVAVGA